MSSTTYEGPGTATSSIGERMRSGRDGAADSGGSPIVSDPRSELQPAGADPRGDEWGRG